MPCRARSLRRRDRSWRGGRYEIYARGLHLLLAAGEHFPPHGHDPGLGMFRRPPLSEDSVARRQRFSRKHRLQPFDLIEAGRTEARRLAEIAVDHHAHQHRAGVPAGGAEASENRFPARILIDMERLWVELARESLDLLGRDLVAAELARLPDLEVLVATQAPSLLCRE